MRVEEEREKRERKGSDDFYFAGTEKRRSKRERSRDLGGQRRVLSRYRMVSVPCHGVTPEKYAGPIRDSLISME